MNKEWFDKSSIEIEVPTDEVFLAIDKGIELGKKGIKVKKRKSIIKMTSIITSTAATLFLASGFIFSPITNALANVPLIGSIYEQFNSEVGKELASKNLVMEHNQVASSSGVDITVTSAFYDGNYIGITFKADGNGLSETLNGENSPEAGYSYHLFEGTESEQWGGIMEQLRKTDDGYIGAMTLEYPHKQLPADLTLPLTFTFVGGVKGTWQFNVPVSQITTEKIMIGEKSTSQDHAYSFVMESVTKAEATTILDYEIIKPIVDEEYLFNLQVFDNQGKKLSLDGVGSGRAILSESIGDDTEFLVIHPEFSKGNELIKLESLKVDLNKK
jgi:hypothetical protein